ncbi:putative Rab5-interacting protein (Rab5ip) [Monocercomonoides exilis]|uniref:putative Rab5-interacting protein (Rab5ip) n=1 Tax=Monocercomonoides exilis TaxID=2049356 RepID=UPI0035593A33|nr:putative Rab5-interacting protein (Rab5ip) [Monocercomonoides exilis]
MKNSSTSSAGNAQSNQEESQCLRKFKARDSNLSTKEWKTISHWFKQVVALILGFIWGVASIEGFMGIILYLIVSSVLILGFSRFYFHLNPEDDQLFEFANLITEGFFNQFAMFLLSWIVIYSGFHF